MRERTQESQASALDNLATVKTHRKKWANIFAVYTCHSYHNSKLFKSFLLIQYYCRLGRYGQYFAKSNVSWDTRTAHFVVDDERRRRRRQPTEAVAMDRNAIWFLPKKTPQCASSNGLAAFCSRSLPGISVSHTYLIWRRYLLAVGCKMQLNTAYKCVDGSSLQRLK